ncbi:hypothetical protein BHM03_00030328 [Ensete ventricosum]|nr:hypothetical protein BHM03_00030328 [Ensete ventricosum]
MYALPWEPLGMALRRRQNACDSTCPGRGAPPHAMMLLIPSFLPALPCLAVPVGALRSTPTNTRNMTTKTSCAWLTKQRGRLSVLCDKSWYLVKCLPLPVSIAETVDGFLTVAFCALQVNRIKSILHGRHFKGAQGTKFDAIQQEKKVVFVNKEQGIRTIHDLSLYNSCTTSSYSCYCE